MIERRYSIPAAVLVLLALVPTLIHSYARVVVTDGRRTANVPQSLVGFTSEPSDREKTWGQRRFEATDWSERRYTSSGDSVLLTILRSYDLKALYHHPELAVAYGTDFLEKHVEVFAAHPGIPVHVLLTGREDGPVGMYVLQYDTRFIDDPISFQIRTAGELLFRGRQAMTLFFAKSDRPAAGASLDAHPAAKVLLAAIESFAETPSAAR